MAGVDDYLKINLIDEFSQSLDKERILAGIEKLELETEHHKFKVGQVIEFTGGYYDNIRYTSRITGFDKDGEIYVLWDCYWFPIKDDEIRQIKIIE